jgi:hypothetical protein
MVFDIHFLTNNLILEAKPDASNKKILAKGGQRAAKKLDESIFTAPSGLFSVARRFFANHHHLSCFSRRTPLLHFRFMLFPLVCFDRELQNFLPSAALPLPACFVSF